MSAPTWPRRAWHSSPTFLGGFKLKGLDYVFNRLPNSGDADLPYPAMPLDEGESIGLFDSHEALADGVVAVIDDLALLNARPEQAFAACAEDFDWDRLGQHLLTSIRAPEARRNAVSGVANVTRAAAG